MHIAKYICTLKHTFQWKMTGRREKQHLSCTLAVHPIAWYSIRPFDEWPNCRSNWSLQTIRKLASIVMITNTAKHFNNGEGKSFWWHKNPALTLENNLSMWLSRSHVTQALQQLAKAAAEEQEILNRYNNALDNSNSNEETDPAASIMDIIFQAKWCQSVLRMTSYGSKEFNRLYERFHKFIRTNWTCGKYCKTKHISKDVLFMALWTLKNRMNWDMMAKTFIL